MPCSRIIRKRPSVSYAITTVTVVYLFGAYMLDAFEWWPAWFTSYFALLFVRGALSTAGFAIVMYLGVLPKGFPGVSQLRLIRAEISIIACLLALGHNIYYGINYFPHLFTDIGALEPAYIVATLISLALIAIMLPLMVTSFHSVRKRMSARKWKRLQRWAYVFYALLYLHVVVVLTASAGPATTLSLAAYSVVFVPYFALRILKHFKVRKKSRSLGWGLAMGQAATALALMILLTYQAPIETWQESYRDGVYTGVGYGYRRNLNLIVTITSGKVSDIKVGKHNEDIEYLEEAEALLPLLIEKQTSEGVDAMSEATRTCKGIFTAYEDALSQAR